jgi:hypothetical protein
MKFMPLLRNTPYWSLAIVGLGVWFLPMAESTLDAEPFTLVGAQPWSPLAEKGSVDEVRLSVFQTDAWKHSFKKGDLKPAAQLPIPKQIPQNPDLLRGTRFTPESYLDQIKTLQQGYCKQRDVLMYFGGVRRQPQPVGLNFNAWSGHDLARLRELDGRPFIGLETMERSDIRAMAWRLKEAGYNKFHRIYVRIGSEPSYSHYGTEDGTRGGIRKTPKAHAAYKERFARAAQEINALNRKLGLNMHTVFTGANNEDFLRYIPDASQFDALGFNLYLTPENKWEMLKMLRTLAKRYPTKPLVVPEFGVATAGPTRTDKPQIKPANPEWALDALGEILTELAKHPGKVGEITVFSVNVAGRMKERRWNWAWTPQMYELLREWQTMPRLWQRTGFHSYDPRSFPIGRDVLFVNLPTMRVVYRRLSQTNHDDIPLFEEISFFRDNIQSDWTHRSQVVSFQGLQTQVHRKYLHPKTKTPRIL